MNSDTINAAYEAMRAAEDALEDAINAAYPAGTRVRYHAGRGWSEGTTEGHSHRGSISVVNTRTERRHRVWFKDIEAVTPEGQS